MDKTIRGAIDSLLSTLQILIVDRLNYQRSDRQFTIDSTNINSDDDDDDDDDDDE